MLNKLNPFRLHDVQVKTTDELTEALKKTGKLAQWDVKGLTPDAVLKRFEQNTGSIFRETRHDAWIGARKVGKFGAITGAIGGAALGLFGGLIMGISFPPSLLAIGITVAVGAAKGAAVGGLGGFVLGGLFKGARTALYLTFTSKRQRLNRSARKGRAELEILEKRHHRKQLTGKKLERLEHLRVHVPVWEYAAHNLKADAEETTIEKQHQSMGQQDTAKEEVRLLDMDGDVSEEKVTSVPAHQVTTDTPAESDQLKSLI